MENLNIYCFPWRFKADKVESLTKMEVALWSSFYHHCFSKLSVTYFSDILSTKVYKISSFLFAGNVHRTMPI